MAKTLYLQVLSWGLMLGMGNTTAVISTCKQQSETYAIWAQHVWSQSPAEGIYGTSHAQ